MVDHRVGQSPEMATAAFRSSSSRSSGGGGGATTEDAGSSNRSAGLHRRARSLSRYSGRVPPEEPADEFPAAPPPRSRFVNTVRGSGFPEISLDDLANEFFPTKGWEEELERSRVGGRTGRRLSDASFAMETESSRRRGRSVSRNGGVENGGGNKGVTDSSSTRRRRSVSVARHRCSDSEGDIDLSHSSRTPQTKLGMLVKENGRQLSSHKPAASNNVLRTSGQKDLQQSHDSYSSQSSLTEDEGRVAHVGKNVVEKTIRAVYAQNKTDHPSGDGEGAGLYEAMRKEVRHAVEEIRVELEKVMVKTKSSLVTDGDGFHTEGSDAIQAIAEIKRNYTTLLVESEKRKQELLAELAAEEYRGQELTKIVRELLPDPKQNGRQERPSRERRRSNEKTRTSKRLTEEAERYFESFISNVEDTDISSFDGERSDTSSTIGGSTKSRDLLVHHAITETQGYLAKAVPLPADTDGVVLPWLQWETNNDSSMLSNSKMDVPLTAHNNLCDASKEVGPSQINHSNTCTSSRGSWSPNSNNCSAISRDIKGDRSVESRSYRQKPQSCREKGYQLDMNEHTNRQQSVDQLSETFWQRQRIDSGSLILCRRNCFGFYGF